MKQMVLGLSMGLGMTLGTALCATAGLAQIKQPLTERTGDPIQGRLVFLDSDRGHCLLCHQLSTVDAPFQGNIGPALDGVGERLPAAHIRARIVDPTVRNPDTVMPAYYRVENLLQVAPAYRGKPILTAQEVEDLVAFMQTQKDRHQDRSP